MTIYDLADILHDRTCRGPHDADCLNCPYYFENIYSNKWFIKGSTHWYALGKAKKIEDETGMALEDIAKVLRAL